MRICKCSRYFFPSYKLCGYARCYSENHWSLVVAMRGAHRISSQSIEFLGISLRDWRSLLRLYLLYWWQDQDQFRAGLLLYPTTAKSRNKSPGSMQKYRAISDGKAQNNQSTDLDLIFEPRPNRSIASVSPAPGSLPRSRPCRGACAGWRSHNQTNHP